MITSSSSENTGFSVELKRRNEEQHGSAPVGKSGVLVALEDPYAASAVLLCDHKNRSPIHFAARYRNLELLRALLKSAGPTAAKLAVTQPDCMGRTPLHYAVNSAAVNAEASFNIEQLLLDHGAKANTADTLGSSPLHLALLKVSLDTFKNTSNLLDNAEDAASNSENKKRQSLQPRRIPSEESDPVETVSNLVADPDVDILAVDSMGHTPLHLAAATGAFVCVSTLLSALGDLDTQKKAMDMQDMNGFTPLGLAVRHKRLTVIMTLLRSGSEVNGKLRVEFASTASRDATSKENGEMEQARTLKFRTYFYHAVMHGLTGVCHMLLSAKFPRRQAIEDAIRCGQLQLANNLLGVLHAGGDGGLETLKQPNEKGETLLHSFAKSAQIGFNPLAQKFAWVLIDAGVSVDAKDRKGNIALHYAAKRGNTQLMDFLHHQSSGQGTENSVNERGETPLLFTLKQIHRAGGLAEDALLAIFCYFMDHPLFSIDGNVVDASGMNALSAFLDRFMESLALSKPSVFFTWIEKLLKRGVSPNVCFQSLRGASLVRKISNDVESWEPRVATMLVKGDEDKIPLLVRVAFTPEAFMRYHTLALLLRYGADLSAADGKGNTLLMHLAARNMLTETRLALGLVRSVSDPKDKTRECSLHVPEASVKAALAKRNTKGLTACHMAVQPLDYGSYENTRLLETLVRAGGDLYVKDSTGKTVIDYALAQRSRLVIRFLERTFPDIVSVHGEVTESTTVFAAVPAYSDDASAYLAECETSGQISRSLVVTRVDDNYDYSGDSRVHCENDGEGTELDALLTKVRAKSGLSVFFRLQLIHDEVEDVYLLFTNWGRIGETGRFRKTPFRDETEAINDFKKIFQSKTGNSWESRAPGEFVKKHKKYNLVQRVSHSTKVDDEVTRSFREDMESGASKGVVFPEPRDPDLLSSPSVMAMLAAITDVRNLQLAAQTSCGFAGGNLLLAKQDDIRVALRNLAEIRGVLEEKEELVKEINTAKDDVSDEGATKRALLSTRHDALIEKLSERSCRYYEVMPCQEDALATSIKAFDQVSDVHLEMTRLRMLSYSMEMHKMLLGAKRLQHIQHPLEYHYHALQVRLAPLQPADPERQLIHRYFFGGLRSSDRRQYRISNVFEVERRGETQRFNDLMEKRPDLRATQTHLLWHGTKRTNLMGILSRGLRVAPPEASHNGYAFGKGVYFADMAEKSLHYCDEPYALPTLYHEDTTREVQYMVLCEVALGKSMELTTDISFRHQKMPLEALDSVKVLAKYTPDPRGTIVSPKSGAKVHLGRAMVLGGSLPFDRAWAKTKPSPTPSHWSERTPRFSDDTQLYLATLLEDPSFTVGDTRTVNDADRPLFVSENKRTVAIQLIDRDSSHPDEDFDALLWCEATVKVTITLESGPGYSYRAKLYHNARRAAQLPEDFALVLPPLSEYAELVVYQETQARLRYIVEVETVRG